MLLQSFDSNYTLKVENDGDTNLTANTIEKFVSFKCSLCEFYRALGHKNDCYQDSLCC